VFTTAPTEALDGVPFPQAVRVTALDAAGKPATLPVDVTIEATSPRGAASLTGTRTAATRAGIATFPQLGISGAGRGFTLTARAAGLPAATSQPFDVWLHFRQVSAGHTSACGLTYENVTWCWGDNTLSRLGVGDDVSRSAPSRVLTELKFDTITSGGIQQCGRLASRDVLCWGGRHPTPTPVAGHKFSWVASGAGSCGVTTEGVFFCWNGPEAAPVITPTLIAQGPFRTSATYGMICGIAPDQRGYCQGGNDRGQLGFTGTAGEAKFTRPVGDLRLTIIAPASFHVCGLATDGAGWCWGDNIYRQLGSAAAGEFSATPVQLDGGRRYTSISVGLRHGCALGTDGDAWCWGTGEQGQLGNGTTGQSAAPVRVVAPGKFASVDAGGYFSCGIGVNGFTYCWGNNNNGELADGTTTNRASAVRVVPPDR
jgi:alpha-tubulin suppressor-like RCC1 family protein